ncbi:MAG: antibiotic biosynthesis monooxygenase [Candidatus Thiodiazotropha sp. (ex. Lucinisca nassula)]|nr:antibiotic biosynthesis monooxygenase [Candidatus Thiodiazotropha sp. (ex. Lucinisca nassula)]MBW9276177.1 antibiotic biosynthesis monooxygenase [Candidatus Thiodiazotropha sp. (ex. Lucinisca nassula)]PUB81274.1 MAG: antibiotic biosynthesis monooxygenase [gamma proteobacterium symbiont of Ctena orbiculata]
MTKKVIIESTVKDGVFDRLMPFLQANLPNVRGFKGCLNVTVFLDNESRIMIFDEEWMSVEDHQKYINTIADSGVMGELISFLESPPEIKYFDRIDV